MFGMYGGDAIAGTDTNLSEHGLHSPDLAAQPVPGHPDDAPCPSNTQPNQ